MSHFTVLVIGKDPEEQLEPFSENLEVPEYSEDCYCIGIEANDRATDKTIAKFGEFDTIRNAYFKLSEAERTDEKWQEMTGEWLKFREQEIAADTEKNSPRADCEECHGTGKTLSTYNPDSKWDWYSIGGRWRGYFKLKDGKEGRQGVPGVFDNETLVQGGVDQALKGDIDFVGTLEAHKKAWDNTISIATHAVVKDGKWYEVGSMGWWGMVTNKKDENEWDAEFEKLVYSLPDDVLLTVFDCHI